MQTSNNPLFVYSNWIASVPAVWSHEAINRAKFGFIDTIGVMVPGAQELVVQKLISIGLLFGEGKSSVIGHTLKTSIVNAALLNGTAAHALDFDDDFDPAKAHPSAVLVPTLLLLAELFEKSGFDLLDAYIVGLEIMGLIGQGLNPFHRKRGWHATITIGTIAATAAASRLLGLDRDQTKNALSISTSFSGGSMAQFGSEMKPLHAGMASSFAIQSAILAKSGIVGGDDTLSGPYGILPLMVGADYLNLRQIMQDKDEYGQKVCFQIENIGSPLMIEKYGLKVKRFPVCGSVLRSLDGLLLLKEKHGFDESDVEKIIVEAPEAHLKNLMFTDPKTPMEAKFSLEYGLSLGLKYGDIKLSDFSENFIKRNEVRKIYPMIERVSVSKLESDWPTKVTVLLKSKIKFQIQISNAIGSIHNPLTSEQVWTKFDSCVGGFITKQKLNCLKIELSNFENLSAEQIARILQI